MPQRKPRVALHVGLSRGGRSTIQARYDPQPGLTRAQDKVPRTTRPKCFWGSTTVHLRRFGLPQSAESDRRSRRLNMRRLLAACLSMGVALRPTGFVGVTATFPV